MKKLLIFLIIISYYFSFSQKSFQDLQSKTLILKLKSENRNISNLNSINDDAFNSIIKNLDIIEFQKLFPKHKPPLHSFNELDNKLIDLSLIYQLQYSNDINEYIIIKKLYSTDLFEYVEQRPQNYLLYIPNDSLQHRQFQLDNLKMYDAWNIEQGDTNIVIGITDTGTDRLHEDLQNIKYNYDDPIDGIDNDNDGFIDNFRGWDVGDNDNEPQVDLIGHGAFVTGISSATIDNGIGIAGTGFKSKYLPVKVSDFAGSLLHDYEGIIYAADQNCDIINASWGGLYGSRFGQDIIDYASFNKNSLVVAACGNSNNNLHIFPASYNNVFSVAALDSFNIRWELSSYGTTVDVSAPGHKVYSSWPGNVYFASSGTSFAAPAVAGIAALVKSHFPNLNALQIGEKIRVNTDIIDTISQNIIYKNMLGTGIANAYKALTDTLKPSLRINKYNFYTNGNQAGDTIYLQTEIINHLMPSTANAKVIISTESPYVGILDSVFNIGILNTNNLINNYSNPFKILVLPNMPYSHDIIVKLSYIDSLINTFEYVHFILKKDFVNIDTNNIQISLSSNGAIGFTDETFANGIGMYYKNYRNIISAAGLVLGTNSSKVSDNIYDDNGWGKDFKMISPISNFNSNWDESYYTIFNDDSAYNTKLGVEVIQRVYANNNVDEDNFVVFDYTFINTNNYDLSNFYAGIYADFDIDISSRNYALYDSVNKMSFTSPTDGGIFGAIKIIGENDSVFCYNLNNSGSGNSINIYDGFLDFEKFQALSSLRDSAGFEDLNGNDVSSMISKGPLIINAGDSIKVKFAFLASEHLYGLQTTAAEIESSFNQTNSISNLKKEIKIDVHPNPFSENINLKINSLNSENAIIEIIDENARIIKVLNIKLNKGDNNYQINLNRFENAVFLIKITTKNQEIIKKIIKV